MAGFGIVEDCANQLTAGVSSWKVKRSNDAAYYTLGSISDADLSIADVSSPTSVKQNLSFLAVFKAVGRMMYTDKTPVLLELDNLVGCDTLHKITMLSGKSFSAGSSETLPMGVGWKLVIPSDPEKNRYIEVTAQRRLNYADVATLIGSAAADGTPDAGDALYAFAPANIQPGGFKQMQIRNVGETTYEDMGNFTAASLEAELITKENQFKALSPLGPNVNVKIEVELMQTADELALMPTIAQAHFSDFKLTAYDGTIFEFTDNLGFTWQYMGKGDAGELASIKFQAEAVIALSTFVAAIS